MSNKSILLIEDDIATQRAYKAVCKGDYVIHTGSTVKEAKAILETEHIDLLLLDHLLPDGTGLDFIDSLCQNGFSKPIIVITAYPSRELVNRYLGLDVVQQLLVKPVDPSLLQFAIQHILNPDNDYTRDLYNYQKMVITADFALPLIHEINNFLTSTIGYLNLWCSRNKKDDDNYRLIKNSLKSANAISNLTSRFLSATKPYKLEWKLTDVNDVLFSAYELACARMKVLCEFQLNLSDSLPKCETVGDLLMQIVLNLILNALQAMQITGGILTVASRLVSPTQICIIVSDTGEGIAEDLMPKIFDPFFTTKQNGVGLGLFVVKRIITQLGGELLFESERMVGTTATIYLPIRRKYSG
ncbi:MAG: response regulator [Candidatus Omnitrophota bacterium]|jgi:signal transduction histidine kinase|nr:MAG: response regulator [Candidatus Omnitrophota bacterium]